MPPLPLTQLRSKLAQCAEVEEKLAVLGKRKDGGGGSSSTDIEAKASRLRTKLCEHYCDVLLTCPDFALRRDVPSKLWKACFYNRISELRQRATKERGRMKKSIKRADKEAAGRHRQAVEDVERSLKKFLKEAMDLYHYLVQQYEAKLLAAVNEGGDAGSDDGDGNGYKSTPSTGTGSTPVILSNSKSARGLFDPNNDDVYATARKEQEDKNKGKRRKGQTSGSSDDDDDSNDGNAEGSGTGTAVPAAVVPILYKLFLFLGDLHRYAMEHDEATECYAKASRLAPGRGNPYNQLAVVAQVSEGNGNLQAHPLLAVALYWYCRSLLADEAFETSESNMERLFVMNRKWVTDNIAAGTDGGIADTIGAAGAAAGITDDASEMTGAASASQFSSRGGSRGSSSNRNRKAQLEASRAAKSEASRKYLAQFVDVHYALRQLTKAIEAKAAAQAAKEAAEAEPPISLTPMMSNSRKDQREGGGPDLASFDLSAMQKRISVLLEGSLSSLLTIAAFSDALLCKLICINAYSYFKAGATGGMSEEIDSDNAAELLSATFLLSFGATLGRQLDWNLSKMKKKKKKDGNQQQLNVRLLSPFVVLCDLISQFYGGGNSLDGEAMSLPLRLRQGKYKEGIAAAAFSKAHFDFWTQVAAVANTVRSMEAFTMLVNTTSASSNMDDDALRRLPLPKEYGDLKGFAPLAGIFALYKEGEAALGSGSDAYLSPEKAVAVLDLSQSQSQSQTQSQGSTSGQKPKEGNTEAHARVLHFLLFLKRHTIAGTPSMEQGQYLFEERGKLTSILDSNASTDDNEEDDVMAHLGSDNDENDKVDVADVEASKKTCASPTLAGGSGEGDANLLVYKNADSGGPALLVPTMFGIGNSGAMDTSTENPGSSTVSRTSLMTGISYPPQQPQSQTRRGMDGVVLEGIHQVQPQYQQGQISSAGAAPPGFVSGAGAPRPPGMMPPSLFAPTNSGGLPSAGMFQGGPGSSGLNTANPFVKPMSMPIPSDNQIMSGGTNMMFPPTQSSLSGGTTGFGIPGPTSGGGIGSGGDLSSSLLGHGGIFGSYDDILNSSAEHETLPDGNWSSRTNNPFATNNI